MTDDSQYGAVSLLVPSWDEDILKRSRYARDHQVIIALIDRIIAPQHDPTDVHGEGAHPLAIHQPSMRHAVWNIANSLGDEDMAEYVQGFLAFLNAHVEPAQSTSISLDEWRVFVDRHR